MIEHDLTRKCFMFHRHLVFISFYFSLFTFSPIIFSVFFRVSFFWGEGRWRWACLTWSSVIINFGYVLRSKPPTFFSVCVCACGFYCLLSFGPRSFCCGIWPGILARCGCRSRQEYKYKFSVAGG